MWLFPGRAVLAEVFLAGGAEFVVPLIAETAAQGPFEELVHADAFASAQDFGAFAYLPAVIVYGGEAVVFFQSHRIEVARYGLVEVHAALAVGFFDSQMLS